MIFQILENNADLVKSCKILEIYAYLLRSCKIIIRRINRPIMTRVDSSSDSEKLQYTLYDSD